MPKELINDETQQRWHTEITWRRKPEGAGTGHVQVATVNLDSPFEFPEREHGDSWEAGDRFDGWRVTLDEPGLDRLIRTLHKVKRQVFGGLVEPDPDEHQLRDVTAMGDRTQVWLCVRREHAGRACAERAATLEQIEAEPQPLKFS